MTHHLSNLQTEFKSYFLELGRDDSSLLRNPFLVSIEQVDEELQSELMDFKNDSSCGDLFKAFIATKF